MTPALPVLTFHALDQRNSAISLTPAVFRYGLTRLHNTGYRTLSLLEAVECLFSGRPLPKWTFVLTFDDGYQSVYTEGFPVLQQFNMTATVFLFIGERQGARPEDRLSPYSGCPRLSWSEIRKMHSLGIDFGAHTLTHADLTHLSDVRIEREVCDSKAIIEDALGAPVACFAYPYGRYDSRTRQIVQQHFACACSDRLGLITAGSDRYALERVDTYYLRSERLFDLMLTGLFPWYIRARGIPRRIRRAVQHHVGRWYGHFTQAY